MSGFAVLPYFISGGIHPFGTLSHQIQINLRTNKPANLPSELSGSLLQKLFGIETDNIRDTITEMLEKEPKNRMTSSDVVNRLTQINQIVRIRCFTLLLTLATTIELSFLFY
jgi:serine/threonine-protein kinase/endoribonuclease IRE1